MTDEEISGELPHDNLCFVPGETLYYSLAKQKNKDHVSCLLSLASQVPEAINRARAYKGETIGICPNPRAYTSVAQEKTQHIFL